MGNRNKWKWAEGEGSRKTFRWAFDNQKPSPDDNDEGDLSKVTQLVIGRTRIQAHWNPKEFSLNP